MRGVDWSLVAENFADALEQPVEARSTFVAARCAGQPAVLAEVNRLLDAMSSVNPSFMQGLDPAQVADVMRAVAATPERVGAYRVVREIGRGGMGEVFLAERADGQFQQRVAVKLLKRGMDTDAIIGRFVRERQILAGLNHANIARLLDGGVSQDGRPYLVMEYVEGQPITQYCDERRLSIDNRLRLFCDVCHAVEYAHRNLVVHRDLKPSNIAVTADGEVKLLDFGIAKLLDPSAAGDYAAPPTHTALRALTPEYASPEQVRAERITIASDVYQLGVLLYELLTGRRPFSVGHASASELERVICETMPRRPSAVASRPQPTPGEPDRSPPIVPARVLRGDLDNIVLKALEKDPERRYASVGALRDDLDRFGRRLPVIARRPTVAYRSARFVGRHRFGVVAAGLVMISLVGGLAATAWQARIAGREARTADEVRDFLVGLFEVSDPDRTSGDTITVRDLLDAGAMRIRSELAGDPVVRAELLATVGEIYRKLALYDRAAPLFDEALEIRRALYGEEHPSTAQSLHDRARLLSDRSDYEAAEALFRQALAIHRRTLSSNDPAVAATLIGLVRPLRALARHDEAEPLAREALGIYRRAYPPNDVRVAGAMNVLALLLHNRGDLDGAEQLYRDALSIQRQHYGEVHSVLAATLNNLAVIAADRGRYDEARDLYAQVLQIEKRLYPEGHPTTAATLGFLGHLHRENGDVPAAERSYREAIGLLRRTLPPGNSNLAGALFTLGTLLLDDGRPAEAEPLLRESFETRRQVFGAEHERTLAAQIALGSSLAGLDRYDEAAAMLTDAATKAAAVLGEGHTVTARARAALERS